MPKRIPERPILQAAVRAAAEKKAEEISVLDLRGLSDVTDYFIICHGNSGRQVQSIADGIEQALAALRRKPSHVEGYAHGEWVLMDYLDIVVHVFTAERRTHYGLERLWSDAPRVPLEGAVAAGRARAAGSAAGHPPKRRDGST